MIPGRERHERGPAEPPTTRTDIRSTLELLLESAEAGPDRPVADLLQERRDLATAPGELEAVAGYLEGFHAADLSLLGTRAVAENEAASAEDGDDIQRVGEGYGALIQRLADRIPSDRAEIRLGLRGHGDRLASGRGAGDGGSRRRRDRSPQPRPS